MGWRDMFFFTSSTSKSPSGKTASVSDHTEDKAAQPVKDSFLQLPGDLENHCCFLLREHRNKNLKAEDIFRGVKNEITKQRSEQFRRKKPDGLFSEEYFIFEEWAKAEVKIPLMYCMCVRLSGESYLFFLNTSKENAIELIEQGQMNKALYCAIRIKDLYRAFFQSRDRYAEISANTILPPELFPEDKVIWPEGCQPLLVMNV